MGDVNRITGMIVDTAYRLHSRVGPGMMETFYESVLAHSLEKQGLHVERQKVVPFEWEEVRIAEACRLDLLVEGCVIVELKSVERLHPVFHKQVLTYLRLLDLPIGLLINFGEASLKNGMHRILNTRTAAAADVATPRRNEYKGTRGDPSEPARENSANSGDSA
jgi:GxxExxY protein